MKSQKPIFWFSAAGLLCSAACLLAARSAKGILSVNLRFAGELFLVIVLVCIAVRLYRSMKAKKVGRRVFGWLMAALQKAAGRINRSVYRFVNRHGSRLHRYQDHVELLSVSGRNPSFRPFRRLKWRNMNTERDKIRYIYIEYIAKAIRTGFRFHPSQTPNEINAALSRLDTLPDTRLFELYNRARYAENDGITPEDVRDLLPSIGKKPRKA